MEYGCSMSTISYVSMLLITANTVANLLANINQNSNEDNNNNREVVNERGDISKTVPLFHSPQFHSLSLQH